MVGWHSIGVEDDIGDGTQVALLHQRAAALMLRQGNDRLLPPIAMSTEETRCEAAEAVTLAVHAAVLAAREEEAVLTAVAIQATAARQQRLSHERCSTPSRTPQMPLLRGPPRTPPRPEGKDAETIPEGVAPRATARAEPDVSGKLAKVPQSVDVEFPRMEVAGRCWQGK